jgi:hypothetical protein
MTQGTGRIIHKATGGLALVTALVLAGCATVPVNAPSGSPTPTPTPTQTESAPAACAADQLVPSFEAAPVQNLVLTNDSDTTCVISAGYATVLALDEKNAPMSPGAKPENDWEVKIVDVTLKPGAAAYAVLSWNYQEGGGDATTQTFTPLDGFQITLPGSDETLTYEYKTRAWINNQGDDAFMVIRPMTSIRTDKQLS